MRREPPRPLNRTGDKNWLCLMRIPLANAWMPRASRAQGAERARQEDRRGQSRHRRRAHGRTHQDRRRTRCAPRREGSSQARGTGTHRSRGARRSRAHRGRAPCGRGAREAERLAAEEKKRLDDEEYEAAKKWMAEEEKKKIVKLLADQKAMRDAQIRRAQTAAAVTLPSPPPGGEGQGEGAPASRAADSKYGSHPRRARIALRSARGKGTQVLQLPRHLPV